MDEPVQPTEGEGGDGLYDLSTVPEDIRPHLEPHFKAIQGNVTKKFQEHADYRKTHEPFDQIEGLYDVDPQELEQLLAFREIANDPERFADWHSQVGEQLGYGAEPETQDQEPGQFDPDVLEQMLQQRLAPVEERLQEWQTRQQVNDEASHIRSEMDRLKTEGFPEDPDIQKVILRLGSEYEGADWVQRGFDDYQQLVAKAETGAFQSKLDAPSTPEQGGSPSSPARPVTSFKEAGEMAMERLRQSS